MEQNRETLLLCGEKGTSICCTVKIRRDGSLSHNRRMPGSQVSWRAPGETSTLVTWCPGKRSAWAQNNTTLVTLHGNKHPRSTHRRVCPTAFLRCPGNGMFGSGQEPHAWFSHRGAMPRSWSPCMAQGSTRATMRPRIQPKTPRRSWTI